MGEIITEVLVANTKIKELIGKRNGLLEQYLEKFCPIQIGDKVKVTGWSHRGKTMKVTSRYMKQLHDDRYIWVASGKILKKDGSPSESYHGTTNQHQYEEASK